MKKERFLFFIVLIVAVFSFFFDIWLHPKDLYFEPVMDGNSAILTLKALRAKTSVTEIIQSPELWKTPATLSYLYQLTSAFPLNNSLMALSMVLFSSPLLAYLAVSSLGGFLAALLAYFMGKKFYDPLTGFVTSILISTSLFFVIHVRGVTMSFYGSLALVAGLVIFTFYLTHVKRSWKSLILASSAGSLAWFHGYTQIYVLPAILLLFLFWNLKWSAFSKIPKNLKPNSWVTYLRNFWGKTLLAPQRYFLAAILTFLIFLSLTIVYSSFLRTPSKLETYEAIPRYNISRLFDMQRNLSREKERVQRSFHEFFTNFFISGGIGSSPGPQNPAGKPMVYPLVTVFFILGIIVAVKEQTMGDKIVLLWVFISACFILFIFEFQTRYMMFPAVGFYLLSARGVVATGRFGKKLFNAKEAPWFSILFFGSVVLFLILSFYHNFFQEYLYKGSNNKENFGYYNLARYLQESVDPKTTALIFEENIYVVPAHLFFHTKGQIYDFVFWKNLQREGPAPWVFNENILGEEIIRWEAKTLSEKEKILYIHGRNPYTCSDFQIFKEQFLKLHPQQREPVDVIVDFNMNPAFEIYKIER